MSASAPEPLTTDNAAAPQAAVLLADGTVVIAQAVLPVWGRRLDVIHARLNEGVGELTQALVHIHELSEHIARLPLQPADEQLPALQALGPQLQHHVEHALSGLQLGDRLSQMLTVVRGDIQRLIDQMPLLGDAGLQHAEEWLEELRSRYTTPEQHEVHGGSAPPHDAHGIDYF